MAPAASSFSPVISPVGERANPVGCPLLLFARTGTLPRASLHCFECVGGCGQSLDVDEEAECTGPLDAKEELQVDARTGRERIRQRDRVKRLW
jgi:hypothetical protein